MERRAALLERGPSPELDAVTTSLEELLATAEPRVRRLTMERDRELLDRLAAEEPVHPVRDAEDLADRLEDDRRCFALEHPALEGRPMNVVWVALCSGLAGEISELLDPSAPTGDPHEADTAVFYSIWTVERGLVGFPGGRPLLLGAIEQLRAEISGLATFATLSPVPGFREWWTERHGSEDHDDATLLAGCARYLTSLDDRGRPIDAVARFHLGNGARLLRLNRHGDRSPRGAARSFGIMANYRYEPEDRQANLAELRSGTVAVGPDVAELGPTVTRMDTR